MTDLDALRARFPGFGFGAYALEPAGAVTLEVYPPDGTVFTFRADTLAAAIAEAFPPDPPPQRPSVFD